MEFDGFTIVAQLLNFALILFVLKRFLYKPLIGAMDEREALLEARIEEARKLKAEAEERSREYREKLVELDDEREERLSTLRKEVEAEDERLHRSLRERIEKLEDDWRASLKRQARTMIEEYRSDLGAEVVATVRAALSDLASRDLEHQLVLRFVELVRELDDDDVEQHLRAQDGKLRVVTAHRLEGAERERLVTALTERFGDIGFSFDVAPELVAGIELRFAGHRLGWSVDDYLDTLETRMKRRLEDADHGQLAEAEIEEGWGGSHAGNAAQ